MHKIQNRCTRETKMTPREPSFTLKRRTNTCQKPKKNQCFLMFLSPENFQETLKEPKAAQETPYELQYPTKKTTKKKEFKCLRGKKCLKLAITFLADFECRLWWLFLLIFKLIVYIMCFYHFFEKG